MITVKGYEPSSFIEWPGKIVSIIFTAGCNFRCGFCHNKSLVTDFDKTADLDFHDVLEKIKARRAWIDAIEFSGGEPLLHPEIETMLREAKDAGFLTKLDTNGCSPEKLRNLISKKLVDYVAMDIKAPFEKYEAVVNSKVDLNKIRESIQIIMSSGLEYEFRTTVLPKLHSKEDIEEIGKMIKGAKKFYLQKFKAMNTLDASYESERSFTDKELRELLEVIRPYVSKAEIRG